MHNRDLGKSARRSVSINLKEIKMKKLVSITVGALVAFTIAAASVTAPAYAGKKERRTAAGLIIGAIGGAIIANEISRNREKRRYRRTYERSYVYDEPRYDRRVYEPRVYARPRLSRWERHVIRCSKRYRSYDERSDTFIGFDGYERRCRL